MRMETKESLKQDYNDELEIQFEKRLHMSRSIPNGKLYKSLKEEIEESCATCRNIDELIHPRR